MKILAAVFLVILALPCVLLAETSDLVVLYCEGKVEVRTGESWRDIDIGEAIKMQSNVRLPAGARLELATKAGTISIFRSGTISLASLVQESKAIGPQGIKEMISARLRKLGNDRSAQQSATAGVRGAEIGVTSLQKSMSAAYNAAMEKGMQSLDAGNLQQSYDNFHDALDLASAGLQVQAAVYAARTALGLGRASLALDRLEGIDPAMDDPLRPAFFLIRAQAALTGLDYGQSKTDFLIVLQFKDIDTESRQEALLGLGLCKRAQGDRQAARDLWAQVRVLDPEAELARIAENLQDSL